MTESPEETTLVIIEPRIPNIGGWLIFLIVVLALGIPGNVQRSIQETRRAIGPSLAHNPSLDTPLDIFTYLEGGVALVSLYCAYVLFAKVPGAAMLAKRSLILMCAMQVAANLVFPIFAAPGDVGPGQWAITNFTLWRLVGPLIFPAIWYTYLSRSKRVRGTYAD